MRVSNPKKDRNEREKNARFNYMWWVLIMFHHKRKKMKREKKKTYLSNVDRVDTRIKQHCNMGANMDSSSW